MRTAAALFVGVVCLLGRSTDARVLCVGEPCVNSRECDRNSLCYIRHRTDASGTCLRQPGALVNQVADGSRCYHAGDCGPCSVCSEEGLCTPSGSLQTHRSRDLKLQLHVERSQNQRLQALVRMQADKMQEIRRPSVLKSFTGKLLLSAGSVVVAVFAVTVAYLKRQTRLARNAAARASARAAAAAASSTRSEPPTLAAEFELEDEDVPEDEERALLSSHEAAAPAELDPEDPNTCKVCFDHVIDCVLLDCGHMSTCMTCARRLRNCPICRNLIRKRKRIFKS